MFWDTANQVDSSRCRNRRPQPDWWDDECFDVMVSREYFRALRLQFHHFVRRRKTTFWHGWLASQERNAANPRLTARNIRQQLRPVRRNVPTSMRSHLSNCGTLEGRGFRDVPSSVIPAPSTYPNLCDDVHRLRGTMCTTTRSLDLPFCRTGASARAATVANRAPGPDGLMYEPFRADDDALRFVLLALFELVRYWAVVPSSWRSATATPFCTNVAQQMNSPTIGPSVCFPVP